MLNLKKRIKHLQENTVSVEAKAVCKEITENFVNISDTQLSSILVEKLGQIEDADKHVEKFILVSNKIADVTNIGIEEGLKKLGNCKYLAVEKTNESKINHPALSYTLSRIESALVLEKTPEYMLVDSMLEAIKPFTWDTAVDEIYTSIKTKTEELKESILVAKNIYLMSKMKGSFIYEGIVKKLEEHFVHPTKASRSNIIEDLAKLNFTPEAKQLSENLKKIQKLEGGIQIIAENDKCEISSVYSPVSLHEGNELFFIKGNFYAKKGDTIQVVTEAKALPEQYLELCRIVSSPNVFIKEGKVSFFIKRNKVEILENESSVDVLFNGSKVPTADFAKHMVSAGFFRMDEAQIAYDVQKITEQFRNIYELDFAKTISSKMYEGCYVNIMKTGDNISLSKVNESQKSNEFFTNLSASQARNIVLEYLGYDIKESLEEYLEKDEKQLVELNQTRIELSKNIAIVEGQVAKIEAAEEDVVIKDNPEIKELKQALKDELLGLKEQYKDIIKRIRTFESAASEAGFETNEEVKIKETGELATILSINSARNSVVVITSSGKSIEMPVSKICSIEDDIEQSNQATATNEDENSDDVDKKKTLIEEKDELVNANPEFVKAFISKDTDNPLAGTEVEVNAEQFSSSGDDDLIDIKIGDKVTQIAKKLVSIDVLNDTGEEQAILNDDIEESLEDLIPSLKKNDIVKYDGDRYIILDIIDDELWIRPLRNPYGGSYHSSPMSYPNLKVKIDNPKLEFFS